MNYCRWKHFLIGWQRFWIQLNLRKALLNLFDFLIWIEYNWLTLNNQYSWLIPRKIFPDNKRSRWLRKCKRVLIVPSYKKPRPALLHSSMSAEDAAIKGECILTCHLTAGVIMFVYNILLCLLSNDSYQMYRQHINFNWQHVTEILYVNSCGNWLSKTKKFLWIDFFGLTFWLTWFYQSEYGQSEVWVLK